MLGRIREWWNGLDYRKQELVIGASISFVIIGGLALFIYEAVKYSDKQDYEYTKMLHEGLKECDKIFVDSKEFFNDRYGGTYLEKAVVYCINEKSVEKLIVFIDADKKEIVGVLHSCEYKKSY